MIGKTNAQVKSGITSLVYPQVLQGVSGLTNGETIDLSAIGFDRLLYFNAMFTGQNVSEINASNKTLTMASVLTGTSGTVAPFFNCTATKIDCSNWTCASTTSMKWLFYQTLALQIILDNFDTSACTNMEQMFNNNANLTSIDCSSFNTENVTTMQYMFNYCTALTSADLSSFKSTALTNASYMFRNCTHLAYLDIRKMELSSVSNTTGFLDNGVPANCEIIVKNETEKAWFNTTFPRFTNVKTVAEL